MFKEIQLSGVFADSKTFVDSVPKGSMAEVAALYHKQKKAPAFNLSEFVRTHFALPVDSVDDFKSDTSKPVAEHLNALWDVLTRKPDIAIAGTLIPLPNSYVVPGGRFREVYYWDSYFTMLGLQAADRWDLIEGMVNNFSYLIDTLGFIPNGNRTYYEGRSQPPFYVLMVELLASKKGDEVLIQHLPHLLKEYHFWMEGAHSLTSATPAHRRAVLMQDGSQLNRYWDDIAAPRPESFREDYELVNAKGGHHKREMYRHIRAAAESGWDFSSRWLKDGESMDSIHTTDIIPVDLNALLYHLERVIAKIYSLLGDTGESEIFNHFAESRQRALICYCWDEQGGFFHDYDFVAGKTTQVYSLAAVYPLYFGMVDQLAADRVTQRITRDFIKAGGLITTLEMTGQQWDSPNGWAPLQWMSIQALRRYGHGPVAEDIKARWVALNKTVYQATGKLVEKYNVLDVGAPGGGGEYELQDGFGWTNGVLHALLQEDVIGYREE
jgi:alpha,alpha-trehalase